MKKRILSALAALCLVFCSCSSSDPDKSPSSDSIYENVGPSTSVSDGNVDVNYSSYEFTVLSSYAFDYEDTGIFEGERNSDKVNEALAKRKQEIEKSFNIVLSELI